MLQYKFLEEVFFKTLLGIRCWDPLLDAPITDALSITLYPIENSEAKTSAYRTRSGIYAFRAIPGLFDHHTMKDYQASGSPQEQKRYVLTIDDVEGRYSSVAILVDLPLPYDGIFLVDDNTQSPAAAPKGFNLYSSPTRAAAPQFAVVRGELIDRDTQQAAVHALVRVQTEEGRSWFGIADADGRFAVHMSYPALDINVNSSPVAGEPTMFLFERSWAISVTVMYDPVSLEPLPGSELFDYLGILTQNAASIYEHSPETDIGEVAELQVQLAYGRDLVLKTNNFSQLYISPTGSPG